ncbi:DNA excision repair protein ERCC-1 [Bagarius yarrelli]|uniref:DNA excision repair protein ERCC-1 n=1 Tax=Bagarius yarrelli TaxID=175774 RepID=A0A556V4W7_BAGYA|nr:DNA excision repair protein ERCC-1 [Bagarius yarrelli]
MQPVSSFRCKGQRESTFHELIPRSELGARTLGSGTNSEVLHSPQRHPKFPRELNLEEQQELRRKINSRERKRMQDLNLAMDALREVMVPYSSSPNSSLGAGGGLQHPYLPLGASPNGRRLSKISTLVLARNYILLLGSSLQEMRRLLGEVSICGNVPHLLLTGGWPFLTRPGQLMLTSPEQPLGLAQCSSLTLNSGLASEESTVWGTTGMAGTPLCPCRVCQVPRVTRSGLEPLYFNLLSHSFIPPPPALTKHVHLFPLLGQTDISANYTHTHTHTPSGVVLTAELSQKADRRCADQHKPEDTVAQGQLRQITSLFQPFSKRGTDDTSTTQSAPQAVGQPLSYAEFAVQSKSRAEERPADGAEKEQHIPQGALECDSATKPSNTQTSTEEPGHPELTAAGSELPVLSVRLEEDLATGQKGDGGQSALITPPTGSGNSIIVSPRQRGNPILKFVRSVPWEFGEVVPDYVLGRTTCALFLSVRYHILNPNYIHERLKQLGQAFTLRVLLVQVDVKDPHHALKDLARICIMADCTLILAWSDIECPGTDKLEVLLGAHNISQKEKQQQRIEVQKCIKHPCYKKNERPNDIMLLKLKSKAKQSYAVKIGVLPKKNENLPANQKCSIAGWGWTKQNSAESSVLQDVMLKGDSGSPLICGNVAEGIAAYTYRKNCVDRNYPQVYTECSGNAKLEVLLGAHNISRKEPQQQKIKVKKCIKHPCYKENQRLNDIMLLKLESRAKLSKTVQVLNLPKKNKNLTANQKCSIAGWGKTSENSAESSVLQEVTLKVQDNIKCKNLWEIYFDTDSMICTASDGKHAFCQGDSGSPLICGNEPQGLAAYTYPQDCLNSEYPEVYMKISYYIPWIKEVIG